MGLRCFTLENDLTGKVPEWSWPRTRSGCYGSCHSLLGLFWVEVDLLFQMSDFMDRITFDRIFHFSSKSMLHFSSFIYCFFWLRLIFTLCKKTDLGDNTGFPVCDVKHIWWDYLIVNSWYLQMNNRWCPLRTVPLCLPSLWKEFQIISSQCSSSRLLYCKVLFRTGCWSILLLWRRTHHVSSQRRLCIYPPVICLFLFLSRFPFYVTSLTHFRTIFPV